jgi:FtsP/CotA-like multicopper oxidase with cupredoxin domain
MPSSPIYGIGYKCILLALIIIIKYVSAGTVTYTWTITNTTQNLDGVTRYALGINGQPGHLTPIIVNKGDRVVVTVINGLNVPTSIHWHGMFQNRTAEMDGPVGKNMRVETLHQILKFRLPI